MKDDYNFTIPLPDGNGGFTPCPELMTEEEAIRFLRLNTLGVIKPANTLRYYREKKKLHATKIGNRNFYTRRACIEFMENMTE